MNLQREWQTGRQERDGWRWAPQGSLESPGVRSRKTGETDPPACPGGRQQQSRGEETPAMGPSVPSFCLPTPRPALPCLICKKRVTNPCSADLQANLRKPRPARLCQRHQAPVTDARLVDASVSWLTPRREPAPYTRTSHQHLTANPFPRKTPSADRSPSPGSYTLPRGSTGSGAGLDSLPQRGQLWFVIRPRSDSA